MPDTLPSCRSCGSEGLKPFLSLGKTPLADALVKPEAVDEPEERFPLDVAFCPDCALVQILEEVPAQKLFVDNYLYFSSFSDHLLRHAREHALGLIASRGLGRDSLVVELASNDGYLLRNFVEAGVPVLGIDPAPDQARVANENGIPTLQEFFGTGLAERLVAEGKRADVIIANNVMAHVPALNDFVAGMARLIADDGLITVENPYVRDLVRHREFDTIYHEHFCYYSCTSVDNLVRRHGLYLNHVEYFPDLHGGTLRWHIAPREDVSDTVKAYLAAEAEEGLTSFEYYADFGTAVEQITSSLLDLLRSLRAEGRTIAAYGAAAKGATLVNSVGIGRDLVEFVVDRNVHKQGLH
ncbi:MAG TPA: class I SAM-dependent methyltransferase, partial [Egibacteraceae bacterium]